MWKISFAAKLLGGFCGALAATEGAMTALESSERRLRGAVIGLLIVVAGGLSIASFYGTSAAALRLTPFSGVKLTLLLPPLLLLFHDLTRRVHPETIGEIIVRPAIWGELVLIGVMLLAMLVMALRSDNVSNVPALEVAFRDFMERVMVVRPRTKEFLIGYPALVLYWYLVRSKYIPHYREVVRIAAVLAFCSAVNTFCHFHTLLYLSVIRVLNGWWLGLLLERSAWRLCTLSLFRFGGGEFQKAFSSLGRENWGKNTTYSFSDTTASATSAMSCLPRQPSLFCVRPELRKAGSPSFPPRRLIVKNASASFPSTAGGSAK